MKRLGIKLSYANVVATLALFIALGGATAFAAMHLAKNSVGPAQLKANAVTGAKVRDGSLSGADVNASSLGTVPAAETAQKANTAARATLAESDAAPEALHLIGGPGEPEFLAGWGNLTPNAQRAAFYEDSEGFVHLQGEVVQSSGNGNVVFFVPPQFAPAQSQTLMVIGTSGPATLSVLSTGSVGASGFLKGQGLFLDGASWRAGQ
jgi:hypothetical protein